MNRHDPHKPATQTVQTVGGITVNIRHRPPPAPRERHPRVVVVTANSSRNDRDTFMRAMYEEHREFIEETLSRRWKVPPASAEDLRQNVMMAVQQYHDQQKPIENPRGFLQAVMWNEVRNRWRARRLPLLPEGDADTSVSPAMDPERAAARAEHLAKIHAYIGLLPDAEAKVIQAVDLMGLTLAEAAEALDCPLGTVTTQHVRALRTLRDLARASERATALGEPARD